MPSYHAIVGENILQKSSLDTVNRVIPCKQNVANNREDANIDFNCLLPCLYCRQVSKNLQDVLAEEMTHELFDGKRIK